MKSNEIDRVMSSQDFESELTDCPLCDSAQYVPWLILTDRNTGLPGEFPLVRCCECGAAYLNPRPSAASISRFYSETYAPHQAPAAKGSNLSCRLKEYGLWKRCQVLLRFQRRGRVLDVGCGMGQFMAAMQQRGWESVGIDQSDRAVTYVKETLGLEAYLGQLEDLAMPEAEFDAVTMWDSLEHLHYPKAALREIWRLLRPGGYLLIRVPSLDSLDRRIFKTNWAGFDAPRHLVCFARHTLMRIVSDCGFSPERIWCMSGGFASFAISWRFFLNFSQESSLSGDWRLNLVDNPFVQLFSFPYFFLIDRLKLGPEITLLARKTAPQLSARKRTI
jgi:SAM-dependent methyltransferase